MNKADRLLSGHRAHDYPLLIQRWRAVAAKAGLIIRRFASAEEGFPLFYVRGRRLPKDGVIYISAGIHGDEPGATEALITWAEKNIRTLRARPFLLIPCINPWGLVHNTRTDSLGRDLNRAFQDDSVPEIAALKRLMGSRRFALAVTLHEDYDGVGIYIYEIRGPKPYWGEKLLSAAAPHILADPRPEIEGRPSDGGLIRPIPDMSIFEKIGIPEALYLHLRGCTRVFTIETPSEYGLDRRIHAHVAVIQRCLKLIGHR